MLTGEEKRALLLAKRLEELELVKEKARQKKLADSIRVDERVDFVSEGLEFRTSGHVFKVGDERELGHLAYMRQEMGRDARILGVWQRWLAL